MNKRTIPLLTSTFLQTTFGYFIIAQYLYVKMLMMRQFVAAIAFR